MKSIRVASSRRRLVTSWLVAALVAAVMGVVTALPASATTCGCTLTGPYVAPATVPLSPSGEGAFTSWGKLPWHGHPAECDSYAGL